MGKAVQGTGTGAQPQLAASCSQGTWEKDLRDQGHV